MTIKDHIAGVCAFEFYRDSQLWYSTEFTGLIFPVPVEDIGNAVFGKTEKGILMMRYIRKFLKTLDDEVSN